MATAKGSVNLKNWGRGRRWPLALALALWPSAVLGTTAPGSEASVATASGAPERAADVAEAGITSGGSALSVDAHEGDDDHLRRDLR